MRHSVPGPTKRTSIALGAIASALLLLPALAGPVSAARPTSAATARHEATIAHWTSERMRSATPRDYVRDPASGRIVPARRPGGGGGGGGVTGASWTAGGTVLTATGKVYFELNSGAYICSGTVVSDTRSNASIVLTAGHCGYDGQDGGFAQNWMFIPDFDGSPTYTCGSTVYGCWTATALVVNSGFANAGGFNTQATQYDWTYAVVGAGGKSGTADLATTVGTFGESYSTISTGTTVDSFGYPAAGKYHGSDLTYCQNPVFLDQYNDNLTYGISCGMTGGSSGGPWFTGFASNGNSGTIQSLNSYGYSGLKNLYGPKFNGHTQATYNAANSTVTANTIVNG